MYYYYTTSGLRRGHIVAEPSISYCAQVQKLFVPPELNYSCIWGAQTTRLARKGRKRPSDGGSVACCQAQEPPLQAVNPPKPAQPR